jgi:endonuclease I
MPVVMHFPPNRRDLPSRPHSKKREAQAAMVRPALLLFVSVMVAVSADGEAARTSYYNGINFDLRGDALRRELSDLLFVHQRLEYSEVWEAFWKLDAGVEGCSASTLRGVYSRYCWDRSQQCGNYKKEGDCFNREHTWPKSWWGGFDKGAGAETDLFLIFPSDGYVNARRANFPYGVVTTVTYNSTNDSWLGGCSPILWHGKCFEPSNDWKGVLARAFFYISTTYFDRWECCDTAGTDRANIKPWMLGVLLEWDEKFPISAFERTLNDKVFGLQKNRNPFVDFPGLAKKVFST